MILDAMIGIGEGYYENDSDNDSFDSALSHLACGLYDDVLFHHAIVPKDTVQAEEQYELLRNSESFSSACSVVQTSSYTSSDFLNEKQENVTPEVWYDSFPTAPNVDGESCNSSHLISSGVSNDDDLSFSDDTLEEGMGNSVIPSTLKEKQIEDFLYQKKEQIVSKSSVPILHWGVPLNPQGTDTNFDEMSSQDTDTNFDEMSDLLTPEEHVVCNVSDDRRILSNPDDNDIIYNLSDVSSSTTPTLERTTVTNTTVPTLGSSIGFFGTSSF